MDRGWCGTEVLEGFFGFPLFYFILFFYEKPNRCFLVIKKIKKDETSFHHV